MNAPHSLRGQVVAVAARAGLSAVAVGVWPDPADSGLAPPPVAGFVESSFSPLVVAAAARCLDQGQPAPPGTEPTEPARGERTAMVIVSGSGDIATAAAVANAVDRGERVSPLLFFASVPNAVAGYVAARWGLTGPVVCLSPAQDELAQALAVVDLLIRDGDADDALVVHVEQAADHGEQDRAVAVLVRAGRGAPTRGVRDAPVPAQRDDELSRTGGRRP